MNQDPAEVSVEPADAIADRHVSMSNRLARAVQSLNLAEKRLIALGLSRTDSVHASALIRGANVGWKMSVSAQEYAEMFGVTPQTAYEQLRDAATKIFERRVSYAVRVVRGKVEKKEFRWVSAKTTYAAGSGAIELNFTPEVAPHLLGLRKHFTTYRLRQAAALDSIYAWRLFELLKSWSSTGRYTPSIEEFHEVMEVPPSCRADFKALRVRVIEPAVASIRAKAHLLVEWKPLRAGGRRVCGLEFHFEPDPQAHLDMGEDSPDALPADTDVS